MGVKGFVNNRHRICFQLRCPERNAVGGSILSGVFFLTQTASKVSHRSNPFLFHYPYGLGADNGNVRFAL